MTIKIIFDNNVDGTSEEHEYQPENDILTPEMKTSFSRLIALNRDAILAALK
jgi:hypothetical protein